MYNKRFQLSKEKDLPHYNISNNQFKPIKVTN